MYMGVWGVFYVYSDGLEHRNICIKLWFLVSRTLLEELAGVVLLEKVR